MRIHREPVLPSSTTTSSAREAAAPKKLAAPKAPDGFTGAPARETVALAMPPPPPVQAADSLWYRTKEHVILNFTGVNYDPHASKLTPADVGQMKKVLQPGDVVLRRTDGTTSNWFIPGYWGHAALYVGDGKIVDATTHDVRQLDVDAFCKEGDAAIVLRPKGIDPEQVARAVEYAREQLGKRYDFDLDFEDDHKFTCTELVETSLKRATGKDWGKVDDLGIAPKDFLNDRFGFVWSNLAVPPK